MVDPRQVMNFRVHAQQLERTRGSLAQTAVLDLGVQNTGPDGGAWALALRGSQGGREGSRAVWTLRAAPHLYRRGDVGQVALAVEPYSEADAGKRIFDASKPLKAAGITNLDALDEVARQMRAIVTRPTAKGDVSTRLATVMSEPYLRYCRACQATHLYEQPFRMAAVRAGLELQPNTSPPVLQRIAGFKKAVRPSEKFDVVRGYLRLLGPATPRHVAEFLDAPLKDVQARWPEDVVEVTVGRERAVDPGRRRGRAGGRFPSDAAARARTTCSCRPATGPRSCRTPPTPRSCGRCSAGPGRCWSTANSSAAGVPASRAGRFGWRYGRGGSCPPPSTRE
jgi:hypothetical protein